MLERELKYDVPADFEMPDLVVDGVTEVSDPEEVALEATYFDTPDHRLAAAGVTLRRRTGGDDAGWHLKVPSAAEPSARHELRVGLGRGVRTVPKRLRATVSGITGGQALSPVAVLRTRRTVRRLVDAKGLVLAEVADDSVDAELVPPDGGLDDAPAPIAWREVEVELVAGEPDLLPRVGSRLDEAGAKRSARQSKVSDLVPGPAAGPEPVVRAKGPVRVLVQHRLSTQLDVLRRLDPLAREDLPEGVHAMRVAVRRLRSALATCRPFLDRSLTDPLRDELGWLSDALGAARDAEVQRDRLDEAIDAMTEERADLDLDTGQVRAALRSDLAEQRDRARAALDDVLASDRYAALLHRLGGLVAEPPWTEHADKRVRGAYRRRVERDLRRVRRRMDAAESAELTPEERRDALHEARKAVKRARYAVEPLRPVYGRSAKRLTKRLKRVQSELGLHQDAVITRCYLLDLTRDGPTPLEPTAALMAGALIERESRAAERYERRAYKAAREVP